MPNLVAVPIPHAGQESVLAADPRYPLDRNTDRPVFPDNDRGDHRTDHVPVLPVPAALPDFLIPATGSSSTASPPPSSRHRNVRVWSLGQTTEVYYSPLGWQTGNGAGSPRSPRSSPAATPEEKVANRQRGDRRARSKVRRLVVTYNLGWMWTLTFADPMTDLAEAWAAFEQFMDQARDRWGSFLYVVVAGVQEQRSANTGAVCWHFHVGIGERRAQPEVAELWGHGTVWCSRSTATRDQTAPERLGRYLLKNMTGAASERVSGRRYRNARGMTIPTADTTVADETEFWELVEHLDGQPVAARRLTAWYGTWALLRHEEAPVSLHLPELPALLPAPETPPAPQTPSAPTTPRRLEGSRSAPHPLHRDSYLSNQGRAQDVLRRRRTSPEVAPRRSAPVRTHGAPAVATWWSVLRHRQASACPSWQHRRGRRPVPRSLLRARQWPRRRPLPRARPPPGRGMGTARAP